jgi:hypothetical protein
MIEIGIMMRCLKRGICNKSKNRGGIYVEGGKIEEVILKRCSYKPSNHKTKVSQNVCVIKCLGTKRLITKRSCHTMKAFIKRQMSQNINIIKR